MVDPGFSRRRQFSVRGVYRRPAAKRAEMRLRSASITCEGAVQYRHRNQVRTSCGRACPVAVARADTFAIYFGLLRIAAETNLAPTWRAESPRPCATRL